VQRAVVRPVKIRHRTQQLPSRLSDTQPVGDGLHQAGADPFEIVRIEVGSKAARGLTAWPALVSIAGQHPGQGNSRVGMPSSISFVYCRPALSKQPERGEAMNGAGIKYLSGEGFPLACLDSKIPWHGR